MDDLAMDGGEARQLLESNGCRVSAEAVEELVSVTEGWATGLYLAALAGLAEDDHESLRRVRGDQREIASYLTAEVLERQSRDVHEFLLQTSVLDELSPSLCRAVTGRDDAHALLTQLAEENLFVTALDDRGKWYRYHHLFAELLRAELQRRQPGRVEVLHRKASAWHREGGDPDRAVRHALAAGDADEVVDLAVRTCDGYNGRGQLELAHRLFGRFSDDEIGRHPSLQLTAGMLAPFLSDQRIHHWARASLTARVGDEPCPIGAASMRSWQLLVGASLARDGVSRMCEEAAQACRLEQVSGSDLSVMTFAQGIYSWALYLAGKPRQAERLLRTTLRQATDADEQAWTQAMLAMIAADQGSWDEVAELDREIWGRGAPYNQLPVLLEHLRLLAHRGDPDLLSCLKQAHEYVTSVLVSSEWRLLLATVVFAEVSLECGDEATAERWTMKAETILRRYPDAGILVGRTRRLREALQRRRLTDPLTPAEQRVLTLLSTQLTASQIAVRLFVSTNTAKTHIRHLYAKLGVTTRNDAVERARALGLVASTDQD
jgi:LuxR family maltose regulon positive regulatory protein